MGKNPGNWGIPAQHCCRDRSSTGKWGKNIRNWGKKVRFGDKTLEIRDKTPGFRDKIPGFREFHPGCRRDRSSTGITAIKTGI